MAIGSALSVYVEYPVFPLGFECLVPWCLRSLSRVLFVLPATIQLYIAGLPSMCWGP